MSTVIARTVSPDGKKYTILERLKSLPHKEFTASKKRLAKLIGKSTRTFERWLYATADDNQEIPANALRLIALYLGCSMEELFNTPPPTLNPKDKTPASLAVKLRLVK